MVAVGDRVVVGVFGKTAVGFSAVVLSWRLIA